MRSIATTILLVIVLPNCTNEKAPEALQKEVITSIEIHLQPAFDNYGTITVDQSLNRIQLTVDTTIKWYKQNNPAPFSMRLDIFRSNTLIDSFYSLTFLDSIRSKPNPPVMRDGLSIYTVLRRPNSSDTINSGNVYPKILSANVISQLDYISNNTEDMALKKYIIDVKEYFH